MEEVQLAPAAVRESGSANTEAEAAVRANKNDVDTKTDHGARREARHMEREKMRDLAWRSARERKRKRKRNKREREREG